ncbi:MAG: biotin transporter BioY [Puniceicoccales bacterium]|jgi:biotin transport system substrate-specific component|nr:biotin transporter BioY [Puniceicoccales bacterium]
MNTENEKICANPVGCGAWVISRDFSIIMLSSLIVLGASHIRVPFYPVPFTMQTFAVVAVSIFAGRRRALWSLLLFVSMWGMFFTTGGYILGFFAVPFIIGNGASKLGNLHLLCRIFCSHLLILATGTAVLAYFIGLTAAFTCGFLFFIPSGIFKGLLVFALVRAAGKFTK